MRPSTDRPRVSIVMPMRNGGKYVDAALRSILAEQLVPLELVVVDDGSTDGSRSVISKVGDPRTRVIDGPCKGIAAAFNAGLQAAKGDIVMRCDADDLYPLGRIAEQVQWLDCHPEFGAICGAFAAMDPRGGSKMPLGYHPEASDITPELRDGITRTHFCSFAVRKDILVETGGMRRYFQTGEDIDLQLRIGEICKVWYAPAVAYLYRIHSTSITHLRDERENLFFEGLAREFQVQRRIRGADDLSLGQAPAVPDFAITNGLRARSHLQGLHVGATWAAAAAGDRRRALGHALHAVRAQPASLAGWRNLLITVIKLSGSLGRTSSGQ